MVPAWMFVSCESCQVEISVRRSPAVCRVSECDREASGVRRPWPTRYCCTVERCNTLDQRFSNFFQVGTTFISQNVLRTTLLLSPLKAKLFEILNYSVWYAIHVNFIFSVFFWTNVQSKRATRAEPEDHLWSADHSLRNVALDQQMHSSDNLLIHSTAPTCFDVCTSSSGSLLLCVLLGYIKICIVVTYVKESLHSVVEANKTLKLN
jgi:hypothetical protein